MPTSSRTAAISSRCGANRCSPKSSFGKRSAQPPIRTTTLRETRYRTFPHRWAFWPIYREGERAERCETTLEEAAIVLGVSQTTVRRLIAEGVLTAEQHCKGAPWIVRRTDLDREDIRRQAACRRSRRPPPDERQPTFLDLPTR
ncbi:MAG: helix-turn-helix domain-containing protein [Alphaproteobacteria bacterium]|nr:helix-turn-helix domain-containing protein [Alphaproteobacteria bacterium]